MTPYGLGTLPLSPDERDFRFREVRARLYAVVEEPIPEDDEVWHAMHGPDFRINQGATGTCTAMSVTNNFLDSPRPHYAFPQFQTVQSAQDFAKAGYLEYTGDTTYQSGASTRSSLQWAIDHGYASAYYRMFSVAEILDALRVGPVIMASAWFNSMFSPRFPNWTSNAYLRVDPASGIGGYHQYLLTGFDLAPDFQMDGADERPFVRIHNSWGTWGANGTARLFLDDFSVLPWWAYVLTEEKF